jgi:hypothetical protein
MCGAKPDGSRLEREVPVCSVQNGQAVALVHGLSFAELARKTEGFSALCKHECVLRWLESHPTGAQLDGFRGTEVELRVVHDEAECRH